MAEVGISSGKPRLVLDAGAIIALTRGDPTARSALARAGRDGYVVVVPTPVLAQVHRGGRTRARLDRVLSSVDAFQPTSARVARRAGELLGLTRKSDAVDAIVAAEALSSPAATILASDPDDLTALVGADSASDRVFISRC